MEAPWRILVVDDAEGVASDTAEWLNGATHSGRVSQPVEVVAEDSFDNALELVSRGGFDLLVLDVFDQAGAAARIGALPEPEGRGVFEQVRSTRFIPIVFLTALPNEVADHEYAPFVQIVSKGDFDPMEALLECVEVCITSPFPRLYRALQAHIDSVSRDFMVKFVEKEWEFLKDRHQDVAHLLMRRLGVSFDGGSIVLTGKPGTTSPVVGKVPPIRYYIVPPLDELRTGGILKAPASSSSANPDSSTRYVIMTPTCDLVEGRGNADAVVLAECIPLETFTEYQNWTEADEGSNRKKKNLLQLLKSNPQKGQQNRYFYLPHAWTLPNMMVDFQRISHITYADLNEYTIEAHLDAPYAEALSHQFHCYLGRVGTPDLDLEAVISRMRP